jgi:hypothetical protein
MVHHLDILNRRRQEISFVVVLPGHKYSRVNQQGCPIQCVDRIVDALTELI